jgi:hypothetical protein
MSQQLAATQAEFMQNYNYDYSSLLTQYPWLSDVQSINNKLFAICGDYGSFPPTQNYLTQFYITDTQNRNFVPDGNFEAIYESLLDYFILYYPYMGTNTQPNTTPVNIIESQTQTTTPIIGQTELGSLINNIPAGISKTVSQGESIVSNIGSFLSSIGIYLIIAVIVIVCFYIFINKKKA